MMNRNLQFAGFADCRRCAMIVVLFLTAAVAGCSKDSGSEGPGSAGSTETVRLAPDRTSVIRNPLSGWVMYLGRSWDENFWTSEGYDAMPTSDGSTVRVSDYATTAYLRTGWSTLETAEGEYVWRDAESRYARMLKSCLDRGLKLALRIVFDGRDQGQNTPLYVVDAVPSFRRNIPASSKPWPRISTTRTRWSSSTHTAPGSGARRMPCSIRTMPTRRRPSSG